MLKLFVASSSIFKRSIAEKNGLIGLNNNFEKMDGLKFSD